MNGGNVGIKGINILCLGVVYFNCDNSIHKMALKTAELCQSLQKKIFKDNEGSGS